MGFAGWGGQLRVPRMGVGERGSEQASGEASSVPALMLGPAVCCDVYEKSLQCPMDLGLLRYYSVEL